MRAGTQTLIQALQALPLLDDPENDDEFMSPGMSPPESDSDDEGKHGGSLLPSVSFLNHNVSQQRLWRHLSTRSIVLWLVLVEGNHRTTRFQLTTRQRVALIRLQVRISCRSR
jgi:hypothetical protein